MRTARRLDHAKGTLGRALPASLLAGGEEAVGVAEANQALTREIHAHTVAVADAGAPIGRGHPSRLAS